MAYKKVKTMMEHSKARVAIYVRVSTLYQVDKDSLPMQKKDLIAYASLILNTDDYVIFEDAGYSGKNTDRPKFQEMMSQIRQGVFTHLLVWKIDRISRNPLDFASMYNELKELGVIFVSKNEQFDTSTAMGEAMLKIILVFAELERNMTSERVTATMISRANNGLWNGGRVPYGYNYDIQTGEFSFNEPEKSVVEMMHNLYEEHRSLICVARILNERQLFSRAGNQWSATTLLIILRNVFYCGDYQYNRLKEGNRQKRKDKSEWITVQDHHLAMISREQKERVIAILDSQAEQYKIHQRKHESKHVHVFGGLMYCNACKKPMNSSPGNVTRDGWEYSKYSCSTRRKSPAACDCPTISDPIVGEFVFNYILNMLNAQRGFAEISSPKELQGRLLCGDAFIQVKGIEPDGLNDLYSVLASGKISGDVYGKGVKIKKDGKKQAQSELSRLRKEKQKAERALERLTNLYLYSDDAMSEKEYIIEKEKLIENLESINERIGLENPDTWNQSVSDEIFVQRASEFIISQNLSGRNYINYKRLASSVDADVLKTFLRGIIDSISVMDGRICSIVFKNGLSHSFIYR